MKRLYICKVIGNGLDPRTAYRPTIQDIVDPATGMLAFNHSTMLSVGSDGKPVHPWCLVIASGQNHSLATPAKGCRQLPDYGFDVKISAMNTATKVGMAKIMTDNGIDPAFLSNADGYRTVIATLGQMHASDFNEDSFDVSE